MGKILIKTSEIIQGDWAVRDMNLLLVFQVNCPGCFMHAYPLALELREHYEEDRLNILTMATAFEDFQLNTAENARRLVEEGVLVGETARAFADMNHRSLPYEVGLPLALDFSGGPDALFGEMELDFITSLIPDQERLTQEEREILRGRVREFTARSPIASYTFTVNQMRGTPSWILFNKECEILEQWFGHRDGPAVVARLNEVLKNP